MNTRTYTQSIDTLTPFLSLGFLLLVFSAYVYFLSASVVHVVIRKEVMSEIASVSSDIGMLEATYIKAQHALSEEMVEAKGFVAIEDKVFLKGRDSSLVLSR